MYLSFPASRADSWLRCLADREVIIWRGLPQLLVIPLVPKLMQRFDARVRIGVGILFFGSSSFFTSHLDSDFAGSQFISRLLSALGQPLIMVPLSTVFTAGMVKGHESGSIRNHRGLCNRLFRLRSGTNAAHSSFLHVSGKRPVFSSHALHRRYRQRGSSPGLPARIQRLFPGSGLCITLKRNCFVLYEKSTYRGCSSDIDGQQRTLSLSFGNRN